MMGLSPRVSRYAFFAFLALALISFHAWQRVSRDVSIYESIDDAAPQDSDHAPSLPMPIGVDAQTEVPPPKLLMIAIWNVYGQSQHLYLPHFFASVKNNPSVDFLIIKYHGEGYACNKPMAGGLSNVKEVCLTEQEYWSLHVDFLCERWICKGDERTATFDAIKRRSDGDTANSYFRPFRADIFRAYFDPGVKLWGWCDFDLIWGDFQRTFPWDEAANFDILIAFEHWTGQEILIFMRGHAAFFRRSPRVTSEFFKFFIFKDVDAFVDHPHLTWATEEGEYSWHALTRTSLTFMTFPAMVESRYHITNTSPTPSVFTCAEEWKWNMSSKALDPPNTRARSAIAEAIHQHKALRVDSKNIQTFTDRGSEYEVKLQIDEWPLSLWFPNKYAVSVRIDDVKGRLKYGEGIRYILRREPHGAVYDRIEPLKHHQILLTPREAFVGPDEDPSRSDVDNFVWVEMLYNHFRLEKYSTWWNMPSIAMENDDVMFVDRDEGLAVWNYGGYVTFETGSLAGTTLNQLGDLQ